MAYKKYKRSNYSRYNKGYSRSQKEKQVDAITGLLGLVGLGIFGIYQKYIKDNLDTINLYIKIFFGILLLALIFYIAYKIRKYFLQKRQEQEKRKNIPVFLTQLESKIKEFTPSQYYKEEKLYQVELVGFLKNNYPNSKIEESIDYKRPDITIENIAIEIKGPTTMSCLKTLPDKINSYLPTWDYLFIVLFNIDIHPDGEKNMQIYSEKKQQILDNVIDSKKQRIFFIEI